MKNYKLLFFAIFAFSFLYLIFIGIFFQFDLEDNALWHYIGWSWTQSEDLLLKQFSSCQLNAFDFRILACAAASFALHPATCFATSSLLSPTSCRNVSLFQLFPVFVLSMSWQMRFGFQYKMATRKRCFHTATACVSSSLGYPLAHLYDQNVNVIRVRQAAPRH